MKHKIGKKERIKLEAELVEVTKKLEELNKIRLYLETSKKSLIFLVKMLNC